MLSEYFQIKDVTTTQVDKDFKFYREVWKTPYMCVLQTFPWYYIKYIWAKPDMQIFEGALKQIRIWSYHFHGINICIATFNVKGKKIHSVLKESKCFIWLANFKSQTDRNLQLTMDAVLLLIIDGFSMIRGFVLLDLKQICREGKTDSIDWHWPF